MISRDTIKLPHMSFGLVPEIFDTVNVVLSLSKDLRMIDAVVLKFRDI